MALFHITMEMKSFFMILLLNSLLFCQSKVIKKDNGLTYITGRGCGTLTPIKHFDSMPKDISELSCAIIKSEKIEKSQGNAFGNENCKFVNKEIGGDSYEYFIVSVETRNTSGKPSCAFYDPNNVLLNPYILTY